MPLSPPVGRQHLHTRRVTCQGFFRDDGLWDIEGRITDEKTYEHANEWRGPLKPGDLVHDMSIRLTVDAQEIDCKFDGIKGLVLRAEFVRKR